MDHELLRKKKQESSLIRTRIIIVCHNAEMQGVGSYPHHMWWNIMKVTERVHATDSFYDFILNQILKKARVEIKGKKSWSLHEEVPHWWWKEIHTVQQISVTQQN